MKPINKFKKIIKCLIAAMVLTCLLSIPVYSMEKQAAVSSIKELNDGTISSLGNNNFAYKSSLPPINKNSGIINLEPEVNYFAQNLTIDLVLRDVDVPSVLRVLAKEGHKNIVIDNTVMGNITAELKKISLNDAMRIVLKSQELEARISDNTIFVASRPAMARKGLNRRCIKAFKLNNSNSVDIAQILEASIFNKGYKVNEQAAGASFAELTTGSSTTSSQQEQSAGSSTGQSNLIDSKVIKGKVQEITPGDNFGDAGKLASTIKIQKTSISTQPIQISNNDGGPIVIPDTRTNSVLVAGLREDILMAEEAIKTLDKALKQVSIEVSLIELKKDNNSDLGLEFNSQDGGVSGGFNSVLGGLSNNYDYVSQANQSGIVLDTFNNLSKRQFAAKLQALIKNKKAKLIANPSILALDDSESLIKITDQVVSKVTTTITETSITYNADIADVGIVLNILPKIGDDDYVTMRVRPSITNSLPEISIGDFQVGGTPAAAIKVTPISTREVILQDVRVKSGETLAIAGLIKENDVEVVGKIPFAGDIPMIGKFFQNKTYEHNKTELIILITPKIVDETIASRV